MNKLTFQLLLLVLYLGCAIIHPSIARAGEVVFQDDFSQGLGKWQATRDTGQYWSVREEQAEAYIDNYFAITEMVPKDEYWNHNVKDLEYELSFTPLEGVDRNISFVYKNLQNWYEIHFSGDAMEVVRLDNKVVSLRKTTTYELINGTTYTLKISRQQNAIRVWINAELIMDIDDWSFNNNYGKIGIKASTGAVAPTRVRFDNIVVRSVDANEGIQLSVPLIMQTDEQWKNLEYDTATKWSSQPSIGRWGCALTSATMILQFHGINTLADGTILTPATLNTWLKSQPDGYLNGGYVNWIAITRLTNTLHDIFDTTKLEYKQLTGNSKTAAITELTQKKPVILAVDGHFMVGNGFTQDKSDLYIKDPSYSYTKFSQHTKSLLSTRVFQPSHTDLSYILAVTKPGVKVVIKEANGSILTNCGAHTERLIDVTDHSNEVSPATSITECSKPTTGQYQVLISQATLQPCELDLLAYDQQANPTVFHYEAMVGTEPTTLTLDFHKDGPSSMSQHMTFTQLRKDLLFLKKAGLITKSYVYQELDRISAYGERASQISKRRHSEYLKKLLIKYANSFKDTGKVFITQQIHTLEQSLP